jgi:hypothetical protein
LSGVQTDGVQHTHDRAERRILALIEATETMEVAEKLVCTVDEMNDHEALSSAIALGEIIYTPAVGSGPISE